jgi:hypothetical protein
MYVFVLSVVTHEPVEFKKQPVEVQDFVKFTYNVVGTYGIYLKLVKGKPKDHNMFFNTYAPKSPRTLHHIIIDENA